MNAKRCNLLDDILGKNHQLLIPVYQRQYSWKKDQCKQLWDDILYAGENNTHHFVGSIVCKENNINSRITKLVVIDGQQRLATIILLLEALSRKIKSQKYVITSEKIRNVYLTNPYEAGDDKYKLILSEEDRKSLNAIIDNNENNLSLNISNNFSWFQSELSKLKEKYYTNLWNGLRNLSVIEMTLDGNDDPQRIFETMNSTGLELKKSDQIRNYILMGLDSDRQTLLYGTYWRRMEETFGQADYERHFDSFVRRYLSMHVSKSKSVQQKQIYATFRKFHKESEWDNEKLLSDMRQFATYYTKIALPEKEPDADLGKSFEDVRDLKADVSHPFLLHLYYDYDKNKRLQKHEFIKIIRLVESYVFRRSVCRLPTADTGSAMLGMLNEYRKGGMEHLKVWLRGLGGNRIFPSNDMFKLSFKSYPKNIEYWPCRLESHHGKKDLSDYSIEHIMPQTPTAEWQSMIGSKWAERTCLGQ